ncbi:MAG: hypothetical protein UR43_C0011G0038 [candidate division TM6 bacterium GW2011_GWF2_33_332]|nr:MAG: hypothetical protein UR43_C0011G0038 [candidate division TM6 bacterium GW2011_GWF2_33_332]
MQIVLLIISNIVTQIALFFIWTFQTDGGPYKINVRWVDLLFV